MTIDFENNWKYLYWENNWTMLCRKLAIFYDLKFSKFNLETFIQVEKEFHFHWVYFISCFYLRKFFND